MPTIPTKHRLARVLADANLKQMANKAELGYYDDFESPIATPCTQLVRDLEDAGHPDLARRARNGEWDATKAEGAAWYKREGHKIFG